VLEQQQKNADQLERVRLLMDVTKVVRKSETGVRVCARSNSDGGGATA